MMAADYEIGRYIGSGLENSLKVIMFEYLIKLFLNWGKNAVERTRMEYLNPTG